MEGFSPRYDAALALAARAHQNQVRKGSNIPYIAHVMHVSVILIRHGFSENVAIAGLLHDVVEDADVSIEAIAAMFGDEIAGLVASVTEIKRVDGVELPWSERKSYKLEQLRAGGAHVAALKAADAIHNARSTSADLRRAGNDVWQRFNAGPVALMQYYTSILDGAREKLGSHPIVIELADAMNDLQQLVSLEN